MTVERLEQRDLLAADMPAAALLSHSEEIIGAQLQGELTSARVADTHLAGIGCTPEAQSVDEVLSDFDLGETHNDVADEIASTVQPAAFHAVYAEDTDPADVHAGYEAIHEPLPFAVVYADAVQSAEALWEQTAHGRFAGQRGDPIVLTWSIVADGTEMPRPDGSRFEGPKVAPSTLVATMNERFGFVSGPVSAQPWFPNIERAFDAWEIVSGVDFVYEPNDDGAPHVESPGELGVRGDVRVGSRLIDGPRGIVALTYFPERGDISLERVDVLQAPDASYITAVMVREIGHALDLQRVEIAPGASVMSPVLNRDLLEPQSHDILQIQRRYGDAHEPSDARDQASDLGDLPLGVSRISSVSIDDKADIDVYRFRV